MQLVEFFEDLHVGKVVIDKDGNQYMQPPKPEARPSSSRTAADAAHAAGSSAGNPADAAPAAERRPTAEAAQAAKDTPVRPPTGSRDTRDDVERGVDSL